MQTKISTSATRWLALRRKRQPRARSTTKLVTVSTPYRTDIAFQLTPTAQSCRSIGSQRLDAASSNITLEQVRRILYSRGLLCGPFGPSLQVPQCPVCGTVQQTVVFGTIVIAILYPASYRNGVTALFVSLITTMRLGHTFEANASDRRLNTVHLAA